MRNLTTVAIVMLVASMFAFSLAAADETPLNGSSRASVVGWGYNYQNAKLDAQRQLEAIAEETGKTPVVTGTVKGKNVHHDPPCWVELQFYLKDRPPFPFD